MLIINIQLFQIIFSDKILMNIKKKLLFHSPEAKFDFAGDMMQSSCAIK